MEKLIKFVLRVYLNSVNYLFPKLGGKHAFMVFCHPFAVTLKKHQARFLETAEHFSVPFEAKTIAGYKWGNGSKKVLCVHGWASHSYRWKKFAQELSKLNYTVYAIDAPAHGNSDGTLFNVPLYARLIDLLIAEYHFDMIVAHSLGAFSTLALLYEKPETKMNKLVAMGMPGEASDFIDLFMAELNLKPYVATNFINYFKGYAKKEPSYYSALKFAKSLNVNGLIIHDTDDRESDYDYAFKVHQVWKDSQFMQTKGLGHKLKHISVVERVIKFLEE